jgi:hypothetical protein
LCGGISKPRWVWGGKAETSSLYIFYIWDMEFFFPQTPLSNLKVGFGGMQFGNYCCTALFASGLWSLSASPICSSQVLDSAHLTSSCPLSLPHDLLYLVLFQDPAFILFAPLCAGIFSVLKNAPSL